jgi:hypothetical protein
MISLSIEQDFVETLANKSAFPKLLQVKEMEAQEFELILSITDADVDKRPSLIDITRTLEQWTAAAGKTNRAADKEMYQLIPTEPIIRYQNV